MIAGIKTAAEALADAIVYEQLFAAPNSIGVKILAEMHRLMQYQANHPDKRFVDVPLSEDIRIPTAAVASIQNTWGYILTVTNGVGKPAGYNGAISNWSRINKISWNI